MTKITTTTSHLAARTSLPKIKRGTPYFGLFNLDHPQLGNRQLAFSADRYAYVGTPLALSLMSMETSPSGKELWEPWTDLTKNIRPNECESDQIIVQVSYDGNEHLRESLLGLGYFEDTNQRVTSGFASYEVWRLTPAFITAFDTVHRKLDF